MSSLTQTLKQDGYPVSGAPVCKAVPSMTVANCSTGTFPNGMCLTSTSGSTASVTLCNPPQSTPFKDLSHYVQGTISYDVPGFFGRVIGLGKMHINVQAVAKHTDSFPESGYAVIALNNVPQSNPASDTCAIKSNGTSSTFVVTGTIRSSGKNCLAGSPSMTVTGSSEMSGLASTGIITGQLGTYTGLNPMTDPYPQIALPPTTPATIYTDATLSTLPVACTQEVAHYAVTSTVPTATNYYVFGDTTGNAVQVDWDTSPGSGTYYYYLLPGCDGTTVTGTVPGVFYFTGAIKNNGGNIGNIQTFSSTVMLPDATSASAFSIKVTGGGKNTDTVFALNAPGAGSDPYTGIALTQLRHTDANGKLICSSGGTPNLPDIALAGNSGLSIPTTGIIDTPCSDITVLGNSSGGTPSVFGAIVANTMKVGGTGGFAVQYDAQGHSFSGGAALVY
jgi:hypothetical protein